MKLADLPDDLQVLVGDFLYQLEPAPTEPEMAALEFAIKEISVEQFPHVAIGDTDARRGQSHAMECPLNQWHPIIMWGEYWMDGRHRMHKARATQTPTIHSINLIEVFPEIPGIIKQTCIAKIAMSQENTAPTKTDWDGSSLDPLPQEQRQKYCYCKEGQSHCGECSCGKPGHIRSLMMMTATWCDTCFKAASKQINDDHDRDTDD